MKTEIQTSTISAEEQKVKSLWTALQVAEGQTEKRGLQFGEAVYKLREKYKIQGTRNDLSPDGEKLEGYLSVLNKLGIPEETARRWRIRYEESIGTRLPKPNPNNRPSETASYKVEAEVEPTAQATSRDVSPDEDSSAEFDPPLLESETTPSAPVVSYEERDREELRYLVKRLNSISIALQQVVDGKAKWSKYGEYAEVVSAGKKVAGLVELLWI
jgi:transposase-like protein